MCVCTRSGPGGEVCCDLPSPGRYYPTVVYYSLCVLCTRGGPGGEVCCHLPSPGRYYPSILQSVCVCVPGVPQEVKCAVTYPLPGGTIVWSIDDEPQDNKNRLAALISPWLQLQALISSMPMINPSTVDEVQRFFVKEAAVCFAKYRIEQTDCISISRNFFVE